MCRAAPFVPPTARYKFPTTTLYGAVRCGAVRCGAVRCGAVRCGAVRCGAVRCGAVRCGAVRCGAVRSPFFLACWADPMERTTRRTAADRGHEHF